MSNLNSTEFSSISLVSGLINRLKFLDPTART